MQRRTLLSSIGGGLTALAAGCVGDEQPEGVLAAAELGPTAVVTAWYEAIEQERIDEANALLHSDGTIGQLSASAVSSEASFEIRSTTTVERTQTEAVLDVELLTGDSGETRQLIRHELQTSEGAWKLFERTVRASDR